MPSVSDADLLTKKGELAEGMRKDLLSITQHTCTVHSEGKYFPQLFSHNTGILCSLNFAIANCTVFDLISILGICHLRGRGRLLGWWRSLMLLSLNLEIFHQSKFSGHSVYLFAREMQKKCQKVIFTTTFSIKRGIKWGWQYWILAEIS